MASSFEANLRHFRSALAGRCRVRLERLAVNRAADSNAARRLRAATSELATLQRCTSKPAHLPWSGMHV
jgi:hypothetical protein